MVLVAVLVIGIGAVATFSGGSSGDADLVELLTSAEATFPGDMVDGYFVGSEDAPLTIRQYEDFQCPFCLSYTARNEPGIIDEYVKTGQVRLEFRNFPILGLESVGAGKAAECAAQQDLFWPLQHELFLLQAEAGQASDEELNVGRFSDSALRGIAGDVGVDLDAYDTCFADGDTLEAVQDSAAEARTFGLSGTPGFLFNGVPLTSGSPPNIEGWREVIDAELTRLAEENGGDDGDGAEATPTP
jgi:protein-disulfide isomerase